MVARYETAMANRSSSTDADGIDTEELPPVVALLMMTGLAQVLALEGALGVTSGHDTTRDFIERTIARLERRGRSG